MKKLLILILLITCLLTVGITPTFCNVNLANADTVIPEEEPPHLLDLQTVDYDTEMDRHSISLVNQNYKITAFFNMYYSTITFKSIGYYSVNVKNVVIHGIYINDIYYDASNNSDKVNLMINLNTDEKLQINSYEYKNNIIFYNSVKDFSATIITSKDIFIIVPTLDSPLDIKVTAKVSYTLEIKELNEQETSSLEKIFTQEGLPLKKTYVPIGWVPTPPLPPPTIPPLKPVEVSKWKEIEKFLKDNKEIAGIGITLVVIGIVATLLAVGLQTGKNKSNNKIDKNNRKNNYQKRR